MVGTVQTVLIFIKPPCTGYSGDTGSKYATLLNLCKCDSSSLPCHTTPLLLVLLYDYILYFLSDRYQLFYCCFAKKQASGRGTVQLSSTVPALYLHIQISTREQFIDRSACFEPKHTHPLYDPTPEIC